MNIQDIKKLNVGEILEDINLKQYTGEGIGNET